MGVLHSQCPETYVHELDIYVTVHLVIHIDTTINYSYSEKAVSTILLAMGPYFTTYQESCEWSIGLLDYSCYNSTLLSMSV